MPISKKRKMQAIISEHFLEPLRVDKVYEDDLVRALHLIIDPKVKVNKIPAMIKKIASLTKTSVISFKIGKSRNLLYNGVEDIFIWYDIRQNIRDLKVKYVGLSPRKLTAYLNKMKKENHEVQSD